MITIDAKGAVLGRLASYAAKQLLKGETVTIVNAEGAVVTGDPHIIYAEYDHKRQRGSRMKGPFYPRYPHMIMRRSIRGMIPYKSAHGMLAMRRLKIMSGTKDEFKHAKPFVKSANELTCKYLTLRQISNHLGAKV